MIAYESWIILYPTAAVAQNNSSMADNFSNQDKGPGGSCTCKKEFDNMQKFLKHVSHSKSCLEAFDPEVIKTLRRDNRLRTKRNWAERNKAELKMKRDNVKKTSGTGYKYIPVSEKYSTRGLSFHRIFKPVFDKVWEKAEKRMHEIASDRKVTSKMEDEALDHVFFNENENIFRINRVGDITNLQKLETAFHHLELKFKEKLDDILINENEKWKIQTLDDMSCGLFKYALDKAFYKFFRGEKFGSAYESIQEDGITLAKEVLHEKLLKATEANGLQNDFYGFMEKIVINKFNGFYLDFKE